MESSEKTKQIASILKAELEKEGLKPIIYHSEALTTVALLVKRDTGEVQSRGVAIQSPQDNGNRKYGNNLAIGRALKAYRAKENGAPIRPFEKGSNYEFRKGHLAAPFMQFAQKRSFMPVLTEYEATLVEREKGLQKAAAT